MAGARKPPKAPPAEKRAIVGSPSTRHPDLIALQEDYAMMRDARAGATKVKSEGTTYLPMPSGFNAQSDGGVAMYGAYKTRAQFPELLNPTILGMAGVVHRREPHIEGLDEGSPLASMWESATPDGLPLEALWARITEEILTLGRCALLADLPVEGGEVPFISLYTGESLLNWSDERDFFVLEEKYRVRTGYDWENRTRYRVLELEDGVYRVRLVSEAGEPLVYIASGGQAQPQEAGQDARADADYIEPQARGGKPLSEIPLVVVGSRDLSLKPDEIPLVGVARAALAIYRLDADYRHQLFMSGQETLFVFGLEPEDIPQYVGAGVVVSLPAGQGVDAKYVGPEGTGIDAHREAIKDEREVAAAAGARLMDTSKGKAESGDALRIRSRAATATLISVALASAAALEKALRNCATMINYDPEKIVVVPNLDFVDSPLTPADAKALVDLWMGKAISYETLYENLQRGDIASQERTAEEEQEAIALEEAAILDETAALGEDPSAEPDLTKGTGTDETQPVPPEELAQLFSPELLTDA